MTTSAPAVHVGIVSWNVAPLLDRCLAALPAALGDLPARVVVVDNASSDGSVAVAHAHPHVEVVVNEANAGYARGMNRAFEGADAPVLIALNPDTEPPPDALAALVKRLSASPDVGLVVPRLVNTDGTVQHSGYRFPSPAVAAIVSLVPRGWLRRSGVGARWWLEGFSPHDRSTDIDWAIGAVHVIRTDALAGGLAYNERWFMYVEDLELCWRLAHAGWRRRLEADVSIPHVGNASGAQAWGDARTARWLEATYDWYRQAHGRLGALGWGVVNIGGLVWLTTLRLVSGVLRPTRRRRHRLEAKGFAHLLRLHVRFSARLLRARA